MICPELLTNNRVNLVASTKQLRYNKLELEYNASIYRLLAQATAKLGSWAVLRLVRVLMFIAAQRSNILTGV